MASSLNGKVALITGAASGIGRATAVKLSKLGCALALTDVVEAGLSETAELCYTEKVIVAQLDVSNAEQCDLVVKETVEYFKRLDHVFNCAGINPTAYPILELPEGYFDKLVAVNLKGTYNVTRSTLSHLKEHADCSFVNVSSILGQRPSKEMAAYCATKYAIIGFSKSMALELGPKGIRVNIVAPGFIDTPTNASVKAGPEAVERSAQSVSLGRLGQAEEVANAVAFLMGDEAKYINGSVVEINGGLAY
ncbi:hypothetical protein PMZ80_006274 [Knufia obscura]|uniref:NAD(P)-binding protein n=1 Tax=Knufia obscura TaxID=1635080 RepID=A0ABR0RK67_9EURO|nr:hypothetical protein PMZ80_006274 [Knufia obscura]